jgi:hypothetical protein
LVRRTIRESDYQFSFNHEFSYTFQKLGATPAAFWTVAHVYDQTIHMGKFFLWFHQSLSINEIITSPIAVSFSGHEVMPTSGPAQSNLLPAEEFRSEQVSIISWFCLLLLKIWRHYKRCSGKSQ